MGTTSCNTPRVDVPQGKDLNQPNKEEEVDTMTCSRGRCKICRMHNHVTRDYCRLICKIHGFNNRATFDYCKCFYLNYRLDLCVVTEVEDQSFFHITEFINQESLNRSPILLSLLLFMEQPLQKMFMSS